MRKTGYHAKFAPLVAAVLAVLLGATLLLGHFHRIGYFPDGSGSGVAIVSAALMSGLAALLLAVAPFVLPGLLFRFSTPVAASPDVADDCANAARAGWLSFEWSAAVGWIVGAFLAVWFWRDEMPSMAETALAILGSGLAGWLAGRFCQGCAQTLEVVDTYAWSLFLVAWAGAAATAIYTTFFVVEAPPFVAAGILALAMLANRLAAASGPQVAVAAVSTVVAAWLAVFLVVDDVADRMLAWSGIAGQSSVHLLVRAETCRSANMLAPDTCAWSEKEALGSICGARLLWRGGDLMVIGMSTGVAPTLALREEGIAAWRFGDAKSGIEVCPPQPLVKESEPLRGKSGGGKKSGGRG